MILNKKAQDSGSVSYLGKIIRIVVFIIIIVIIIAIMRTNILKVIKSLFGG